MKINPWDGARQSMITARSNPRTRRMNNDELQNYKGSDALIVSDSFRFAAQRSRLIEKRDSLLG